MSEEVFQKRYKYLVWSNPDAPADVFVAAALIRPQFHVLLDAAVEFGIDVVEAQWRDLEKENSPEFLRAKPTTSRILKNIRHGYEQAQT